MKAKHILAISLLAFASAGAEAATTLTGSGAALSDTESSITIHPNGTFSDSWSLVVDETIGAADVNISVSDVHGSLLGYTVNIDNLAVTGSPTFAGGGDSLFYTGTLENGTYNFTIGGDATGDNTVNGYSFGGAYEVSLNAAPVPLPPAALLFGSALVGLAALRRRKNS